MNLLQILSLMLIAVGMSLMAYALGWLVMRQLVGRGAVFGSPLSEVPSSPEAEAPVVRPVFKLIANSSRNVIRLFSGRREAA